MGYVEFEKGSYVKKGRPTSFWSETDKAVTLDTNERLGTSHEVGSTYRSTQGGKRKNLSVDHKVSYDSIANALVRMLNQVQGLATKSDQTVAAEVRTFKSNFMGVLYHDPGDGAAWANRNQELDARIRLAALERALLDCYVDLDGSTGEVCAAAHSLLLALNSSADNLRDGYARVNSAIQQYFDPHVVTLPDGSEQFTPRTKSMALSDFADEIGVCLTPSGNHYLTSDYCTARLVGSLTPVSHAALEGMANKTMKSTKWSEDGTSAKKRRIS